MELLLISAVISIRKSDYVVPWQSLRLPSIATASILEALAPRPISKTIFPLFTPGMIIVGRWKSMAWRNARVHEIYYHSNSVTCYTAQIPRHDQTIHRVHANISNTNPTYVLTDLITKHQWPVGSNRINIRSRNNDATVNRVMIVPARNMTDYREINYEVKSNHNLYVLRISIYKPTGNASFLSLRVFINHSIVIPRRDACFLENYRPGYSVVNAKKPIRISR